MIRVIHSAQEAVKTYRESMNTAAAVPLGAIKMESCRTLVGAALANTGDRRDR